jgi:hypothetical protein
MNQAKILVHVRPMAVPMLAAVAGDVLLGKPADIEIDCIAARWEHAMFSVIFEVHPKLERWMPISDTRRCSGQSSNPAITRQAAVADVVKLHDRAQQCITHFGKSPARILWSPTGAVCVPVTQASDTSDPVFADHRSLTVPGDPSTPRIEATGTLASLL